MEELVKELREARLHADAGAMEAAERHIRAALKLFNAAPRGSMPEAVRGHIVHAGRAVVRSHSLEAVSALDAALLTLETHGRGGE